MPRPTWALVTLLIGCAMHRGAGDEALAPAAPPASVIIPAPADEAPAPACTYNNEPPAQFPELRAPVDGPCRRTPRDVLRELQAAVREQWKEEWPTGRLEVRGGCDRLDAQLDSVVFEASSGHGGSLTLARFDRRPDGAYDLVLLEYNHSLGHRDKDPEDPWQADSSGTLVVHHARLGSAVIARLLDRLRTAVHLEIEEHEPAPRRDGVVLRSWGASGTDSHVALRLADRRGQGVQRHFAGYATSGDQQQDSVPLAIAAEAVSRLLDDARLRATFTRVTAADPAARDLFARVFWAARARGDDYGYWYVRERLLGMAALLGEHQHVPALLAQLRRTSEISVVRSAVLAINAIAALTGYDVRHDLAGRPRPPMRVIADTLAACERR